MFYTKEILINNRAKKIRDIRKGIRDLSDYILSQWLLSTLLQ